MVRSTEATNEKIEKFKKSSQAKLQAEVDGLRGKTDEVINILDKERDLSAANATAIQETLAKALLNAEARRRAADAETTAEDLRATGRLLAILSPDRDFGRRIDLTTQAVTKFYTSIYGFERTPTSPRKDSWRDSGNRSCNCLARLQLDWCLLHVC